MDAQGTSDQYKRFFTMSRDMLCIASPRGYFEHVNEAFCVGLGYAREELFEHPFFDLIHPADLDQTHAELERLNQGLSIINFENRYKHAAGHYITLSWSATYDVESNLIYASARDVTVQVLSRNKLKQIERALREKTILAETDSKGVIVSVNDQFCEISGYTREEIIGNTHALINSGYHPKSFFKSMWRTISSGTVWSGVIKNKKKDGEFYYVQSILIPLLDCRANISGYLAVRQDITQSIINRNRLEKTLTILNETGSIAKIGGWELEVETGELIWTNETFKIFEVDNDLDHSLLLKEAIKIFTPESEKKLASAIRRTIIFGEFFELELEIITPKGNELWVYINGKANYSDGRVIAVSGTVQNINDKKIAEHKFDLERQKSIQNSKLVSLGELSASIAHEINNPLGIISGYCEIIQDMSNMPEKISTKMDVIQQSCERISHIVKSLRKFSRTEANSDRTSLVLSDIVEEAISLARFRMNKEFVAFTFERQSELEVLCNEIEIEQVILNLINNSLHAIRSLEEKWINIRVFEEGGTLYLKFTDSGSGIPEKVQSRLFEPFYTTKKAGEGTGLGLAIVKGILDDHKATISFDKSSIHTAFLIAFPVLEVKAYAR